MTEVSLEDLDEITREILERKPDYVRKNYLALSEETGMIPYQIREKRVMAIMRDVVFGCTDRGGVALMFTAMDTEASGSGVYLYVEDAVGLIKSYGVNDVHELNGKPIWMLHYGNMLTWLEPCIVKVK